MPKSLRELQREVWREFHGRCCVCSGPAGFELVHEIEPRSRGKDTIRKENMIPICAKCHDEVVHSQGTNDEQVEYLHGVKKAMEKKLGINQS